MVRKSSIVIAVLASCAAATVGMGSAAAATQVPFTITETNIQFFDDYDSGDFTTTGRYARLARSSTPIEPSPGSRGSPEW